eukprot:Skav224694  [mRNA]  locus=scaffold3171:199661:200599:+ [translate_table: standard]
MWLRSFLLWLQLQHAAAEGDDTCALQRTAGDLTADARQNPVGAAPCLSFIHIPKTGGGSIELASLLAVNLTLEVQQTVWRCAKTVSQRRKGTAPPGTAGTAALLQQARTWGMCDDQLRCQTTMMNAHNGTCHVPRIFDASKNQTGGSAAFLDGHCSRWHVPPGLDSTLAASYNNCNTFCVVRDPIQRLLSEYNFNKSETLGDMLPCGDSYLEDFVRSKLQSISTVDDCHFIPQVYYVFENGDYQNGKRLCHHVLRAESISQEFPQLMQLYGLGVRLPDIQRHQRRSCDASLSPAAMELVKKFYAADFQAFGY